MADRAPDVNGPGSVKRCLRECEQMLRARGPRGAPNFLPLLADRFARDRLRAIALVDGHVARDFGGVRFVNCGSVGKPKDGDPRGAFAILTPGTESVEVTIERVAYDATAVTDEVRRAGLPGEFADKLMLAT